MQILEGDTFLNKRTCEVPGHLWIVVSDPLQGPDEVLIVNLTTHTSYEDQTCVLDVGDHPFIKHKSVIRYRNANCTTTTGLENGFSGGVLFAQSPMDIDVLGRVRQGLIDSKHSKRDYKTILRDQGLVS